MNRIKKIPGLLIVILISSYSCNMFSQQASEKTMNGNLKHGIMINTIVNQDLLKSYRHIGQLKKSNGTILGDAYVKSVNDTIFYSLIIAKDFNVIYEIEKLNFWNTRGVDFDINKNRDNFFGYQLLLNKNDHLVLGCYYNKGKNVADDITLEWNDEKSLFEIPMAP